MKAEVEAIIREMEIMKKDINPTIVKEEFDRRYKNNNHSVGFYDYFDSFIESSKTTKSDGIILIYKILLKKLHAFEAKTNYKIDFDTIDLKFYDRFVHYLITVDALTNNTVGSYIKTLKTFMNWALDRGYHSNIVFKKFYKQNEEADTIYLTEEELNKIVTIDLSENPFLAEIRDAFLMLCFTSIRCSDLKSIKKENISDGFIKIITQKTKDGLKVPITKQIQRILDNN